MKKIIAFAGSNSQKSINKQLAEYAAKQLDHTEYTFLDLNDFDIPMYGIDREQADGIPAAATQFNDLITNADGVIVSLAEHNGSYTAVFKNLYDWLSRIDQKVWKDKPMLLMATSPGGRGGIGVLTTARNTFPRMGANLVSSFSLPFFTTNFKEGIIEDPGLRAQLGYAAEAFEKAL